MKRQKKLFSTLLAGALLLSLAADADIPLLIGSNLLEWSFFPSENPDVSPEENDLARQMSQVWVSFARNGVPSADGLQDWESYTRESGATMLLDMESKLVHHHDRDNGFAGPGL